MLDLAGFLKSILKDQRMTQSDLAKKLHMSDSAISGYVGSSRTPSLRNLEYILRKLGYELVIKPINKERK